MSTGRDPENPGGADTAAARGAVARWWRPFLGTVLAIGTVVLLAVFWQSVVGWFRTLSTTDWRWAAAAVAVQLLSMQCLVWQQQILLRAGGGTAPTGSLTATVYGGNAISVGLPLAGSAASVAYAFRRMRDLGNSAALVSWVLAVSGVCSTVALAAVVAVSASATGSPFGAAVASVASVAAVVPVLTLLAVTRSPEAKDLVVKVLAAVLSPLSRWFRVLRPAVVGPAVDDALTSLGAIRPGVRNAGLAGLLAVANWLLDALCLWFAVEAVGAELSLRGTVLAFAAGALVSSTRLTPGGIGVVEAAVASALVAAGLPAAQAVPAVVVYRLASLYLLAAIGALCLVLAPRPVHPPED
ncbi:YbhN family protein [Klenkia sp. PcliD-1-E]|uniref:lysylphosphatidylglycerol synthase transmembrane domain-containing protein n=1 Tax=Klenkia sp. PcliD-1-E TaxID=2954492 RepID=UPI002096A0B8|nr:YbhN family protein [Klenkia sp. PcliD-1-E]MCO7222319.1 YbhN family protein [Klenkia sp. PcliD-1-E]